MSEQLVKDKQLFADYLREDCHDLTNEDIDSVVDEIILSGAREFSQKFNRLHKEGRLKDGMVVTLKDRVLPVMYAGRVYVNPESIGIKGFELYYVPK